MSVKGGASTALTTLLALLLVSSAGCVVGDGSDSGTSSPRELVLATTTSTYNTGLLDELNREFEERYGVRVKVLPQGTGAALQTARAGDADLVMVHARSLEDEFLEDGFGVNRRDLMYNDFVVVGPGGDPAGVSGADSAADAFRKIRDSEATFLSRGDDSGTHTRELEIWRSAIGGRPSGYWYREVGKGMGATLVQADQADAYTLADRGTFLSIEGNTDLEVVVQGPLKGGDPALSNPYGVMVVNPARYPGANYEDAMLYVGFVTGPAGQEIIGGYAAGGERLFHPGGLSEEPNFEQYVPEGALKGDTPAEWPAVD